MASTRAVAFVNGRVFTGRRWVEAVGISDGVVDAVGDGAAVRRASPTGTEVVDLAGDWLVPGLVDAHLHLAGSVLALDGPDLRGARSFSELEQRLRGAAPGRRAVLARGWDDTLLAERRYPGRDDLDRWDLGLPAVLYRVCEHVATLNSLALDALGLEERSSDPPGGRLGRSNGRLDGRLYDGALALTAPLVGAAYATAAATTARFLRSLGALGLTTVAPMAVDPIEVAQAVSSISGEPMPVRLRPYVGRRFLGGGGPSLPSPTPALRYAGVKLFADGSLGARTAWLLEPYADAPGSSGSPPYPTADLDESLEAADEAGLAVAVHAIGDGAIAAVLEAFAARPPRLRPRLEHASVTPPGLIRRLAACRPSLVVQPRFAVSDTWLSERLGPDRARWTYALRSLRSAGLVLAGSSDAPIEPVDPWTGLRAAASSRPSSPGEALSAPEAFGLYTTGAAQALREPRLGSLEAGALGDAVRVSGRSWESLLELGAGGVLATYVGGLPVFERGPAGRDPQRR